MKKNNTAGLLTILLVFALSAFALLAFRDESFDPGALITGAVLIAMLAGSYKVLTKVYQRIDGYLLIIVNSLITIGTVMLYRIDPDIAYKQLLAIALGLFVMVVMMILLRDLDKFNNKKLCYILMGVSVAFLALPMVIGKEQGGAKNWIDLGFFSLQPGEFVKLSLIFAGAVYLSEQTKLKRMIPLGGFFIVLLGLLMIERDLGAALLYAFVTVALYYAATGNLWVTLGGLGLGAGVAVSSYYLFSHVRVRVAAWINPWGNYYTSGYQIAQGLMAIASGGFFGRGLTLGTPNLVPAYHTDYIFAVICEEMGIVVGLCVIAMYVLFLLRGMSIAMAATSRFMGILALGCTLMISLQAFVILAGIIKLIPLTGVTLPFVSYGGSSMLMGLMCVALLEIVAYQNGKRREGAQES